MELNSMGTLESENLKDQSFDKDQRGSGEPVRPLAF
jgi:hypothetical protein